VAIGLSAFIVKAQEEYLARNVSTDDLGSFIEEQLKPDIVVPVPGAPMRDTMLSDGRFDLLSASWKRGVKQIIQNGTCDRYDMELAIAGGDNVGFLLAKAQAIVESNCDADAVGGADDVGLNQVRTVACTEAGVEGDRTDPFINSLCAAGYRKVLCRKYKVCPTLAAMYASYNRGPTGASRVADHEALEYTRKIHFVLLALIRATQRSS